MAQVTNYISRNEAEEHCNEMMRRFLGQDIVALKAVDIAAFIRKFLYCCVKYEYIDEDDKDIVGFTGNGIAKLCILKNGLRQRQVIPKDMIIIDNYLQRPGQEIHKRFILAHEAGHVIAGRLCPDSPGCCYHSYDATRTSYTVEELKERFGIGERQADMIGACLLMPRDKMYAFLRALNEGRKIPVYGTWVFSPKEKVILKQMEDTLQVSHTALMYRLKELNFLDSKPMADFKYTEHGMGSWI